MEDFHFKLSQTTSTNINLLRIYACQMVAIAHGLSLIMNLGITIEIGKTALEVFFLMSGILTAYSLFNKKKDKKYTFKKYVINRFSRLYPPLIVVLIAVIFIDGFWMTFNELDASVGAYNIQSFITSLFLLNDSAFGFPSFGSANPLWTLPLFWWMFMLLGWVMLGLKTIKKTYKYYIILGIFASLVLIVYCGPLYQEDLISNIRLLLVWVSGIFILLLLKEFQKITQNKSFINTRAKTELNLSQMQSYDFSFYKKLFNYSHIYGILSAFLFILAWINKLITLDAYSMYHIMLVIFSVFFLFLYSQYTQFRYNNKFKKVINFFSSYSYTLYILHFSINHFFVPFKDTINPLLLFIIGWLLSNGLSILIALFTERKAKNIENYLLKKFHLK